MNIVTIGALLLLAGGLVHTIPPIATGLTNVFNGTPVVQIVIGAVSIIIGLLMFIKKTALS